MATRFRGVFCQSGFATLAAGGTLFLSVVFFAWSLSAKTKPHNGFPLRGFVVLGWGVG